jgi:hypothetical protein
MLNVELRDPKGRARLPMLVDSGADETLISSSVFRRLGGVPSGEEVQLLGVGGGKITGHVATAEIAFKTFVFKSRVVVSHDIDDQMHVRAPRLLRALLDGLRRPTTRVSHRRPPKLTLSFRGGSSPTPLPPPRGGAAEQQLLQRHRPARRLDDSLGGFGREPPNPALQDVADPGWRDARPPGELCLR